MIKMFLDHNFMSIFVDSNPKQRAQLSLRWDRPYWLSVAFKVIQGR